MEKRELTSLDIYYLLKELKELEGNYLNKVYQKEETLYLVLRGKDKNILAIGPNRLHIKEKKPEFPQKPPNFPMLLRKHLVNSKLKSIKQHNFDRVIVLTFTNGEKLVAELFGKGNYLLLDESNEIIQPFRFQDWEARSLKPKKKYKFPPAGKNPLQINKSDFSMYVQDSDKDIVKLIAADFGFGGLYAEEICLRANVKKNKDASEVFVNDIPLLHEKMQGLFNQTLDPVLVIEKEKPISYAPFKLERYKEKTLRKKESFNKACDEYYSSIEQKKEEKEEEKEEERLKEREGKQKSRLEELKKQKLKLKKEADKLAAEHKFEEAAKKYNKIKKYRGKIPGLQAAIEETRKKIEKQKAEEEKKKEKEEIKSKKSKEPSGEGKWYSKFRWFRTSTGALVVAGKDATTNEILIKKHTRDEETVLHAEIAGAPFCVIKNKKKPKKTDLREAAIFAASYSKAWKKGYGAIDVYAVKGEQVTKEAPAGEYVGKGAFMIKGKKNYLKNTKLELAIGVDKNFNLISGPKLSVEKRAVVYSVINPGGMDGKKLAQRIKGEWMKMTSKDQKSKIKRIKPDKIRRYIPSNKGSLA